MGRCENSAESGRSGPGDRRRRRRPVYCKGVAEQRWLLRLDRGACWAVGCRTSSGERAAHWSIIGLERGQRNFGSFEAPGAQLLEALHEPAGRGPPRSGPKSETSRGAPDRGRIGEDIGSVDRLRTFNTGFFPEEHGPRLHRIPAPVLERNSVRSLLRTWGRFEVSPMTS